MTGHHFFSRSRMGQDIRAWPMLVLLLVVVVAAIGCVLWFMREAMRNERMAVREKLAEVYRGQLALVQKSVVENWSRRLAQLDTPERGAAEFARCVRNGLADSVICLDDDWSYPRPPRPPGQERGGEKLKADLRTRFKAETPERAAEFVLERFAAKETADILDDQGRGVAANAELMALEALAGRPDPRFEQIAARLRDRLLDYEADILPSAQRRFLMHELQRLDPSIGFPTLTAEDLAASFLESNPKAAALPMLRPTEFSDGWCVAAGEHVIALFATSTIRLRLDEAIRESPLPDGVKVDVILPEEDPATDATLVTMPLGLALPRWRLALSFDDSTFVDAAADQRIVRYVSTGSIVLALIAVLAMIIARGFGRQVQLARLKNDLVANVSHELKTPLTAMRALVDTLLDTARFDEKTTREYLQLLATENARLSRLIDNFLTFSRLERNKFNFHFAPLRPEAVVDGAVAALGDRARAPGCTLESHVAKDLPAINGDSDALVTALLNLLDNAWKYSGDEKRIILRTEARNGSVHFTVQDNGIGLSRRESRAVFDRFHQADSRLSRTAGGCGLGLSIVRSIVAAHRGTVHVASEPGCGSSFTIEIPAVLP